MAVDLYQRLKKVSDYIHDNLDQELDLNRLAEVACLSPYHWHRLYHGAMGEPVSQTVRRIRLHKAAADLVRTTQPIEKIARAYGYASSASFSRAFRQQYQIPPAQYRSKGQLTAIDLEPKKSHKKERGGSIMYPVEIVQFPGIDTISIKHEGDYMNIGQKFEALYALAASQGILSDQYRGFGIYYHDPNITPPEQLQSRACLAGPGIKQLEETEGFELYTIPASPCVKLTFKGPYNELEQPYSWLYGQWLPQSGRVPGEYPSFEEYLNNPREVAATELITEIYAPLLDA